MPTSCLWWVREHVADPFVRRGTILRPCRREEGPQVSPAPYPTCISNAITGRGVPSRSYETKRIPSPAWIVFFPLD